MNGDDFDKYITKLEKLYGNDWNVQLLMEKRF